MIHVFCAHMTTHSYGHAEPNVHIEKVAAFGWPCMSHAAQEILLAPAWVVEAMSCRLEHPRIHICGLCRT